MYTGTLIADLMKTVERVERRALRNRIDEGAELPRMFELQAQRMDSETVLAGAA